MTFANPSFLWAFAGLAIPLAIHLLSRKEGKIIRVGSIRHVEESNTSQFKSIRLNEVILFFLRCLMISLLVLFMAGARCTNPASKEIKWVVTERGLNVDSLTAKGYELHYMPENVNYWTYIEGLNKLPHEIIVVSSSRVEKFNGERVSLNDNIKWITAEPVTKQFQALAWQVGDSVFVRNAQSGAMMTTYNTTVGVPDSIDVIRPAVVNVKTNDKIVIAALNVLKKQYKLPIETSGTQQPTINIRVAPNVGPLVEKISANEIRINKTLDQDVALDENLVIELFRLLYPELQKPQVNADARVMPDAFAWAAGSSSTPVHNLTATRGIEKYLIALFMLSLAAERFVAIRRNQ